MKAELISSVNAENTNLIDVEIIEYITQGEQESYSGKQLYFNLKFYILGKKSTYIWTYEYNEEGKQQRSEDLQKILILMNE